MSLSRRALPVVVVAVLGAVAAAFPVAAQNGLEYDIPTRDSGARDIVSGPDGNLWFTQTTINRIGRLAGGEITEFPIPTTGTQPWSIVSGPGAALWFTQRGAGSVGRITTSGVVFEFPLPTANSQPEGITVGPDGNLWIACYRAESIVRLTPTGQATEFPVPGAGPSGIAAGPDGNLWVTAYDSGEILRVTPAGIVTPYPLPDPKAFPTFIAGGPEGALWFIESGRNVLGRITTGGVLTEIPLPGENMGISDLATGPDGSLWMSSLAQPRFVRRTPAGRFVLHPTVPFSGPPFVATLALHAGSAWLVLPERDTIARVDIGADAVDFAPRDRFQIRALTPTSGAEIWYASFKEEYPSRGRVGHLFSDGSVEEFERAANAGRPSGILVGPDGKIWVTDDGRELHRYEPATGALLGKVPLYGNEAAGSLAIGPDGAVWMGRNSRVARIDPISFNVVEYPFPQDDNDTARSLVAGPDGALWFLQGRNAHRLRMSGSLTTFPLSQYGGEIVTGLDDNLWVLSPDTYWQLTPSGQLVSFGTGGFALAAGLDGAQWFVSSEGYPNRATRVTTAGVRSTVLMPFWYSFNAYPTHGAIDALGNYWTARSDRFTRVTTAATLAGTGLFLIEPCRLVDTRTPDGPEGGPGLSAHGARTMTLTGRCNVPAGARALALNVTAVDVASSGSLSAHPGDVAATGTNVVALRAGVTRAGFATLGLGANGSLTVRNLSPGFTGFILDVTGYFK